MARTRRITIPKKKKKERKKKGNDDGMVTHLKPTILECEVKWALRSTTLTKLVDITEFRLSYFKS